MNRDRWSLWASVIVAACALAIAILLPSTVRPECPPPSTGVRCASSTDVHAWIRLGIGALGVVPMLIVIGHQRRGGPWVSMTVLAMGTTTAVVLGLRGGLVPTTLGDCPPYPRCFTAGHPYLGVAFAVFVLTVMLAIWLWDKDYPPPSRKPATTNAPATHRA